MADFEREFEKAIMMLEKGKHSGKIGKKEKHVYVLHDGDKKIKHKKYEELYFVALESA